MSRSVVLTALTVAVALVPLAVLAQTPPAATPSPTPEEPMSAERLRDEVLHQLAGWRLGAAEEALDAHRAELGSTPEFQTAHGVLLAAKGKTADGLKQLESAVGKLPADPVAPFWRGEVVYWSQTYSAATAHWETARSRAQGLVGKDPKDARARYYLGAAQVRLKKYGDARGNLDAALANGWSAAQVHAMRGLAELFDKKYQPAVDVLTRGAEADARFAPLYFYRGLAWNQLGKKDRMLNDMDTFVKLAPSHPDSSKAKVYLSSAGG